MLATLRSIAESVSRQANLDSALVCFVQMVKDAMKTQCCSIYFADYTSINIPFKRYNLSYRIPITYPGRDLYGAYPLRSLCRDGGRDY